MNLTVKIILVTIVAAFAAGCASQSHDDFNWGHKAINYVESQKKVQK